MWVEFLLAPLSYLLPSLKIWVQTSDQVFPHFIPFAPTMTPSSYTKSTRKPKPASRRRNNAALFSTSNLLEPSAPITSPSVPKLDDSENICSTPKAERFRIPEVGTCPPAPKKRRVRAAAAAALSFRRTPLAFFAPPDLELFFYFALRGIQLWLLLLYYLYVFLFFFW